MVAENLLIELSIVAIAALLITGITRWLKHPYLVGYILAGIVASRVLLNLVGLDVGFAPLAKISTSLLLFTVGLNLNPRAVKKLGKVVFIAGLGRLIFTFIFSFVIAVLLGFSTIVAVYIALALSFSSTIVVMQLLSNREEMQTLHGRIAIGFLLVQDLFHIIAIVTLSTFATISLGSSVVSVAVNTAIRGIVLAVGLFVVSVSVLPLLMKLIARSQEMLLFFAVGWAFAIAALFHYLHLTIEIGALLAGVALSLSPYKFEIVSKLKPLRDFFLLIFFISLALAMGPIRFKEDFLPIIIFSLLVLVGTPIIVMLLMGRLGYTSRNSFLAGISAAQISEFSFIITALGVELGHISSETLSLVIVIGLITIAGSSYGFTHSRTIYQLISKYAVVFERKSRKVDEGRYHVREDHEVILFGYNRIGYDLLKAFGNLKKRFLVVDYNPETTLRLARKGVDCRYGDANDLELLEQLNLRGAEMIISTIPEKETNLLLIKTIKMINKNATTLVVAYHVEDTLELYRAGATYVIMPHFLGGKHTAALIEKYGLQKNHFLREKARSLKELRLRQLVRHRHPTHERG